MYSMQVLVSLWEVAHACEHCVYLFWMSFSPLPLLSLTLSLSDSWSQCTRSKRPGKGGRGVPGTAASASLASTRTAVALQANQALSPTTPSWSVSSRSEEGRSKSTPPPLKPVCYIHKQKLRCMMGIIFIRCQPIHKGKEFEKRLHFTIL